MSLCFSYDFEKHTTVTFAIIATVLIIGLGYLLMLNETYGRSLQDLENELNESTRY
jgi:hypothetical protein